MALQKTFLNIRGTKIQMLKGGSGDPLLSLHSVGGEIVELPFFTQLARHHTVYIPAHPGFSQSEGLEKIDTIEDLCNPKLRDRLYRVTVPTLVLWGASDRLIPVAHGNAYHEGIDGSKFVLMEKCGHAPPLEKPEETVKILREFFRG